MQGLHNYLCVTVDLGALRLDSLEKWKQWMNAAIGPTMPHSVSMISVAYHVLVSFA